MNEPEAFESVSYLLDLLRGAEEAHGGQLRMKVKFRNKHGEYRKGGSSELFADSLLRELEEALRLARRYQAVVDFAGDVIDKFKTP